MTYYSPQKVLEIINEYYNSLNCIQHVSKEHASVGVSQYGIEAVMPKGNNISNVVEKEALRQLEDTKYFAEMYTDIKYLQDRLYRVRNEQDAIILKFKLDGYSAIDISRIMNCSRDNVHKRLRTIANTIVSYPQANYTNYTD